MKLVRQNFCLKDYKDFDREKREILLIDDADCEELLDEFYTRVSSAIERRINFPVLRLADGEFQFLLGKNEVNFRKPIHKLVFHIIKQYLEKFMKKEFVAKSRTYSSGVYSQSDMKSVKQQYLQCLRYISDNGVLAIYSVIKPGFFSEQYIPDLLKYFARGNIKLKSSNFYPFYFVYIILTNPRFSGVYYKKHVHLITSFDSDRKAKIENSLRSLGVSKITWTKISQSRSLFDKIDVKTIERDVDLIFIGAGVGKVNIFNQLKDFPATIIDAGYIFETWQNRNLVKERDYCEVH